jgi:peptide/nickel transport system substrate-binding protein
MLDLAKAEEEFRLAWGGELWDTGFKLPLAYSISNPPAKTIAEMLEANVESLNPKFHVDPIEVECDLTPLILTRALPAFYFCVRWLPPSVDYPDADSLFRSFVHSEEGIAPFFQHYSNASVDARALRNGNVLPPEPPYDPKLVLTREQDEQEKFWNPWEDL